MKSIHSVHRSHSLARRAGLSATIGLALAASVVPLAAQSTDAAMAVALKDTDGTKGWLLKRGTSVLASQNANFVFEPASTIKFLHHLHAELLIQNNWVSPEQPITGTNLYIGSCPLDSVGWSQWTEPLEDAMSKMMWNSDNSRTEAIKDYFGVTAINNTAHTLGAVNTNLIHKLGCADMALLYPNQMTLTDVTTLYRTAFTGDLLTPERRQHMWARMPNKLQALKDTASWEAATTYGLVLTGLPKAFSDNLKVALKGGGYTLCSNGGCKYYRSIAGYVEIPFQTTYGIPISLRYTFGIFIDKATNEPNADEALDLAIREIFRLELRRAIGTFL